MNIKTKFRNAVTKTQRVARNSYRNPKQFRENLVEVGTPGLGSALVQVGVPVLLPGLATPYYFQQVRKGALWGVLVAVGGAALLTDMQVSESEEV